MKSSAGDKIWLATAIVAAVAGGVVAFSLKTDTPNPPATPNVVPTGVVADTQIQVYWLNSQGDQLVATNRLIKQKNRLDTLRAGLEALITEPAPDPNLFSAIPKNTKILDLSIDGRDIRVNLSREFQAGGGASSIQGRLAQLLYTLTSIDPSAGVYLSIEGKPVEYLGGEGIEVKQPMYRKDYADILR
jgi:spore germination protein GerM